MGITTDATHALSQIAHLVIVHTVLSEFFHASLALSRPDTRIDRLGTLRLALLRAQLHLR